MAEALMAEFADKEALVEAIRDLKQQGLDHMDAYTPFPVQEAIDALGLKRSRIPWVALFAGLTGGSLAYLIMWWINVVDYPLNVIDAMEFLRDKLSKVDRNVEFIDSMSG